MLELDERNDPQAILSAWVASAVNWVSPERHLEAAQRCSYQIHLPVDRVPARPAVRDTKRGFRSRRDHPVLLPGRVASRVELLRSGSPTADVDGALGQDRRCRSGGAVG